MLSHRSKDGLVYYVFPRLEQAGACNAVMTRLSGRSQAPFASLNLGYSVGDNGDIVAANRRRAFAALNVAEDRVVTCHQVHSATVASVGDSDGGAGAVSPEGIIPAPDALVSKQHGLYLFLRFADCVPVIFCDPRHGVVALAHAGWKGTLANIVAATVEAMAAQFGSDPAGVLAGIAPAIGPCHYIVQEDVAQLVRAALPFWPDILHKEEGVGCRLDLPQANRRLLVAAGLSENNIEMAGLCTACHTDEFYSHRAERGQTGRFGVFVGWEGRGHDD